MALSNDLIVSGFKGDGICQLVPANGIYAVFKNKAGRKFKKKIDVIALTISGNIFCLSMNEDGVFFCPKKTNNFVSFEKNE